MKLRFLGAAREVTGSCFLVDADNVRFLVDCGMVQGGRDATARNRQPFGFDPGSVDFVLLTHAHIDHSGLLPKLTNSGFKGPIYATAATVDLIGVMLPDSAHIQESDAKHYAKRTHGKTPLPLLYTVQDARECLEQAEPVKYEVEFSPHPSVRCRFRDAGHILGSAIVEIWVTENDRETKLVFSGDLGQPGRPILRDPTLIEDADLGRGIAQDLIRTSRHCRPRLVRPYMEKLARTQTRAVMFEMGKILLPREAFWLATYLEELLGFPTGGPTPRWRWYFWHLRASWKPYAQDLFNCLRRRYSVASMAA